MPYHWAQSTLRQPIIWLSVGIFFLTLMVLILGLRMRQEYLIAETKIINKVDVSEKEIIEAQRNASIAKKLATKHTQDIKDSKHEIKSLENRLNTHGHTNK